MNGDHQGEEQESNSQSSQNQSQKWKNPSVQHLERYGLRALPDDFVPTREEQMLMNMYETIQKYERTAAKIKEEAARAKLAARDAEFQQKLARPKNKRKRKHKKKKSDGGGGGGDGEEGFSSGDEDEDDYDSDDEHQTLHERREAKIAALREEVEAKKKQTKEDKEEEMRQEHLQTMGGGESEFDHDDTAVGGRIERRKVESSNPASLIANLTAGATPPHDFSKKLGLTPSKGKVLFPTSLEETKWTPPDGVFSPNDGAFLVQLDGFDVNKAQYGQGNNTIAIKFMAPADSKRFSLNVGLADAANNNDFDSILFHFNPRHFERGGQLIINDKQTGVWGQALAVPLSQIPLVFGQTSCTLIIQINGDGFDVFLEDKHIARLEHRTELPSNGGNLVLQFPSTDDYGSPENWVVYKVWWGNMPRRASSSQTDLSHVAGVNSYNALHPRKLFVSGLTKIHSEAEIDLRRAELERAFRKYGGDRGVQVLVPTNSTYAFVEMETERQTDLALSEMSGQYRLNRARRSKHEALQEERQAKASSSGAVPEAATATTTTTTTTTSKKGGGGGAAAAPAAAAATTISRKKNTADWD